MAIADRALASAGFKEESSIVERKAMAELKLDECDLGFRRRTRGQ